MRSNSALFQAAASQPSTLWPMNSVDQVAREKHPSSNWTGSPSSNLLERKDSMVRGWTKWIFCFFLLLEIPLLVLLALDLAGQYWERFASQYLLKQMELMTWTPERMASELTYYHRACDAPSTRNAADLLITTEMSAQEATDRMIQHGAVVFPNLLSARTAATLREFILEENKKQKDMVYVIANDNRWSFYLKVDQHPTVTQALQEVLNHPQLVDTLERIVGRDPAVIEFTTITAAYGAMPQHWHQDVVPESNGAKYARNFIPSYSLFIPLQDTTAGMGATGICPGTHMFAEGCDEMCSRLGFQMSKAGTVRNGTEEAWPTGWGALVNQQTTHIGTAHTDPYGPHRVLFILTFAPRPQFGKQRLETRMIGMGGSYSLHWSQWGHTLQDFANPKQNMRFPFRILKSIGLYKTRGWDFITQTAGRIANTDVGYDRDEFDDFLTKGGFYFLPRWLQGQPPAEDVSDTQTWIQFVTDTTHICQTAVQLALVRYFGFYMVVIAVGTLLLSQRGNRVRALAASIISRTTRIVVLYGIFYGIASWRYANFENHSSWAHNVRHGRMYRVPTGSHITLPDLPASLPLKDDVLILHEMQSEYMASFSKVLDVVHPGNKAWNALISEYAAGYKEYSSGLQEQLRFDLLHTIRSQQQRRIMIKNIQGNWAEVEDKIADWFCHKALLSASDNYINQAMTVIDYLVSETRFGYWRDTVMYQIHIPIMLIKFQDVIIGKSRRRQVRRSATFPFNRQSLAVSSPLNTPRTVKSFAQSRTRPRPWRSELPELLAWSKEGDVVEAMSADGIPDWYRANITVASSDSYTWDVLYDDGDESQGLCSRCIRKFEPYKVGEQIEVSYKKDFIYYPGQVLAASHNHEAFDVRVTNGPILKNVPVSRLRRGTSKTFVRGERVLAQFPESPGEWYSGSIAKINKDGSFAIRYDDGDFVPNVPMQWVVKMVDEEEEEEEEDDEEE